MCVKFVYIYIYIYIYVYLHSKYFFFQYKEFEEVVVEDRIQKEIQRRKAEEEEMQLRASVKVSKLKKN